MLEPTSKALQYFEEKAMKAMKRKVTKAKKRLSNFEKHYLALKNSLVNADFTELNQMSDDENTFCFYFTTPMFPKDLFRVAMELNCDKVWVESTQKNEQGITRWTFSGCFEDVNREDFIQYFDHVFYERGRKQC
jgi:hypothetical protein